MTTMQEKRDWRDLAVFGGPPACFTPLHVGRPNIGRRELFLERLAGALDRAWLTNDGQLVREFERRVAALAGVRHCVAVASGMRALEVAIVALGLEGEVIMPSLTFIGTAHALRWLGRTPVFADVDPATLNLDAADVERRVTARTSAILGVHLFGRPCDVEALEGVARRHGLRLLFDACHALGAERQGRPVGGFGDAEVFSFHATKFVSCGEGGALVTNDDEVAERARRLRNFGFDSTGRVTGLGTNAKLSEPHAALGLASLDQFDEFVAINRRNYEAYRDALATVPGLELLEHDLDRPGNFQYVIVRVDANRSGVDRDWIQRVLEAEGILARRYFHPGCHRSPPYDAEQRDAPRRDLGAAPLPVTERAVRQLLALPTGEAVTPEAISRIAQVLRLAVELPQFLRVRFPQRRRVVSPPVESCLCSTSPEAPPLIVAGLDPLVQQFGPRVGPEIEQF